MNANNFWPSELIKMPRWLSVLVLAISLTGCSLFTPTESHPSFNYADFATTTKLERTQYTTPTITLAADRADVASLRTVAGNLDNQAFLAYHKLAPMPQAVSAIDYSERLRLIPQLHFVGARDNILPAELFAKIRRAFASHCWQEQLVDAAYRDGWTQHWVSLLKLKPQCREPST